MKIVIKIGGSLLQDNGEISVERIFRYAEIIRKLREEGHNLATVVGGGEHCPKIYRSYEKTECIRCDLRLNRYKDS